jgi:tRNA 2-selenouridine synthase
MVNYLATDSFIEKPGTLIDVRSPCEYFKGHIPGALNIPLFTDEERAAVGTTYKNQGAHPAFTLGIQYVGPKLGTLIENARSSSENGQLRLYCARGGMRSKSVSEMLLAAGLEVLTLKNGYKDFRHWTLNTFNKPYKLHLIGGFTGCGKTKALNELKQMGEQTIDLESLACHRGSAFGNLTQEQQPTNQQFENQIALLLNSCNANFPIWIEDESRFIGNCKIPDALYDQIQKAPLFLIERSLEERLEILKQDYLGFYHENNFIHAVEKIRDRLGGERTKMVIDCLRSGMLKNAAEILLAYYDNAYLNAMSRRTGTVIAFDGKGLINNLLAKQLIEGGKHAHTY